MSSESEDFIRGYRKAEKELKLMPEDIGVIYNLVHQLQHKYEYEYTNDLYAEVLERFNEARNER